MSLEVGSLFVVIGAKTQEFSNSLLRVEKEMQGLESRFEGFGRIGERMTGFGTKLMVGLTLPITGLGAAITKIGSDANESENLFEVSFASMADAARAWSDQVSQALGINAYELRKNAGMFNVMFKSMGFGEQAAYQMSTGLAQLSYDFASFYNLKPDEAFEKIRSGITGEIEPLRSLGILVDENNVKTYAYKNGIAAQGKELTEAQKVAARYGVILESTKAAQGDLVRTGDQVANQARRTTASLQELAATLYKNLEPSIKVILIKINEWIAGFKKITPEQQKVVLIAAALAALIGPLTFGIGILLKTIQAWAVAVKTVTLAFNALRVAILTNPMGLLITAIIAVTAAIIGFAVAWSKNWFGIRDKTRSIAELISSYFSQMVTNIAIGFNTLKARVYGVIGCILDAISPIAKVLPDTLQEAFEQARYAVAKKNNDIQGELYKLHTNSAEAALKTGKAMGNLKEAFSSWETPKKIGSPTVEIPVIFDYQNLDKSMIPVQEILGKVGEAAAASTTRWTGTSEALANSLSILRAQHEKAALAAEMHGDRLISLKLDGKHLNEELARQKEIVARVREEIAASTAAGVLEGESQEDLAKRTDELNKKLADEEKALAELEKQIYDNNAAIKNHSRELRDLSVELSRVEKKYREDLSAALEDYEEKVRETNNRLAEDEQALTREYQTQVEQRAKALRDFVGLFDEVTSKEVSGGQLLENLRGQVKTFEEWGNNIRALAARGVDQGLIAELREMGPKAAPEIAALNTLTDNELAEYVSLWQTKNKDAREEAVSQLERQRNEMEQKLVEIRAAASQQLELYRVEWQRKNAEIRKNAEEELNRINQKFIDIAGAGTEYGVSLLANFTGGMESQFEGLRRTLENMAGIVDSYMPHSPARVGPLKRLAEWGPSLVKGLTEGIRISMPNLSAVSYNLAEAIRNPIINVAPALPVAAAGGVSAPANVIINIHGNNADEIWAKFRREMVRAGYKGLV